MDPRDRLRIRTALKMSRSAAFVGTLIGRAKKRPMQFYETMKSTTACHYRMQSMKLKFSIHFMHEGETSSAFGSSLPPGIELVVADPVTDRKSIFVGRACHIDNPSEGC